MMSKIDWEKNVEANVKSSHSKRGTLGFLILAIYKIYHHNNMKNRHVR